MPLKHRFPHILSCDNNCCASALKAVDHRCNCLTPASANTNPLAATPFRPHPEVPCSARRRFLTALSPSLTSSHLPSFRLLIIRSRPFFMREAHFCISLSILFQFKKAIVVPVRRNTKYFIAVTIFRNPYPPAGAENVQFKEAIGVFTSVDPLNYCRDSTRVNQCNITGAIAQNRILCKRTIQREPNRVRQSGSAWYRSLLCRYASTL